MMFDLDGTLIDSVYQHVLAWQETLLAFGIICRSGRSVEEIRELNHSHRRLTRSAGT
jgi:beta-phosphoglucomutase-like phosphatase (HAD superfamily)